MVTKAPSSQDVRLSNSSSNETDRLTSGTIVREGTPKRDVALIESWLLALGAGGRKPKTQRIYCDSACALSHWAADKGYPGLEGMGKNVVRGYMASLHQRGAKPATVHVHYRSLNTFFKWLVKEEERADNPMDFVDPPRIPDEIQPFYSSDEVRQVLKAIPGKTIHQHRDIAIVMVLYDTGVRSAELVGMKVEDIDWRERAVLVTGKNGKQRKVSFGAKTAEVVDRYRRKRKTDSPWLWVGNGDSRLQIDGLRMVLLRRFKDAGVTFRGAHAFRRGFAMAFLEAGGQEGDLKYLGGWESYAMVTRYARASQAERAVRAHKAFSPGDRLNAR